MIRILCFCAAAMLLSSCSTTALYSWYGYDKATYKYENTRSDESLVNLEKEFNRIMYKQKGTAQRVPPGVCAEQGFILASKGQLVPAKLLFRREVELYPESKPFMERVIQLVEQEAQKTIDKEKQQEATSDQVSASESQEGGAP